MPALIGGFGKINSNSIKINNNNSININSNENKNHDLNEKNLIELKSKLGAYLAGLIEADGSIAVHDINSDAKKYCPKILIVFSLPDKPLADKLCIVTKTGRIYSKNNAGHIIWHIQKKEEVIKIINIINGYMRTPKIEALNRAIDWFNQYDACNLNKSGLDNSPINSNAWLAGFTDGDGNFSINLINRKKRGTITTKRLQAFFRIELRQSYHRNVSNELGGNSYFYILDKIARFLNVNLYSRSRVQKDKTFYAFIVISHNLDSHKKIIEYFEKYPLYSSKYLSYKDWYFVINKMIDRKGKPITPEEILEIERIKSQFNSKRTSFDFSHLNNLY